MTHCDVYAKYHEIHYLLFPPSHNAIRFGLFFTQNQYKLFTLGTVLCFSELDISIFVMQITSQKGTVLSVR